MRAEPRTGTGTGMTFEKIKEDNLWCHPKVLALHPRKCRGAMRAWVMCNSFLAHQYEMCSSAGDATGLVITAATLKQLSCTVGEADELARVGIWARVAGGYEVIEEFYE